MMEKVATTALPVDRLSATDCNAAARANGLMGSDHAIFACTQSYDELFQPYTKYVLIYAFPKA